MTANFFKQRLTEIALVFVIISQYGIYGQSTSSFLIATSYSYEMSQSNMMASSAIQQSVATASITPTASLTSSVVASASCVPMNHTSCNTGHCCKGDAGAWTGLDSSKKVAYNETSCSYGNAQLIQREKPCSEVCVNKECDSSKATMLVIQTGTFVFAFFAYWIAATP